VPDEQKRSKLLEKNCKRLAYLADRLVSDLEEGDKIFVHLLPRVFTEAEMRSLFSAIRRYNPANVLLCVGMPEPGRRDGELRLVEPGLLHGYIEMNYEPGILAKGNFNGWKNLCRAALKLRTAITPAA
jgi:hypothetical protein